MAGWKRVMIVCAAAFPILFSGCFDFFVSYKIYPNGNTLAKIDYEFPNYGEYNVGYLFAPDIVKNLSNDGFRNVKNWYSNGTYHVTGEKYGTIDMLSSSNGLKQTVTVDKKNGIRNTSYLFSMVINREKAPDDSETGGFLPAMMANHAMVVDIEMPGVIVSTNGKKISDNRIRFEYPMSKIFYGDGNISLKAESSVSMKDRYFSASVRADNRLADLDGKIQEIGIKMCEVKSRTEDLEAYIPLMDKDIEQSNAAVAALYTRLAGLYASQAGVKPQMDREIIDFFKRKGVDFDLFPEPIDGQMIFDAEKGLFRIVPKGAAQ